MKQRLSLMLCVIALFSSSVFIHADELKIKWLDVGKADFLDENSNLLVYTKGDFGTGLMDLDGKDVVEYDQYMDIKVYGDFIRTVSKNPFYDDAEGVKNSYPNSFKLFYKRGQIFKSHEFEYIGNLKENMLVAKKNGKYGYIDPSGKTVIEFKYDYAEDFFNGLAVVAEKRGNILWYGLINKRGGSVFKMNHDEIINLDDKVLVVSTGGLYNYYDLSGKRLNGNKFYKYGSKFTQGYSVVGEKDQNNVMKYGLINQYGVQIIASKYDGIFPFDTKFAVFMKREGKDAKYGLIDLHDKEVLAPDYDFIGTFGDKLCPIGRGDKFGYIDFDAKIVCDFKYDKAMRFKNAMAAVKKNGKWGYIDVNMKEVIPFQFDKAFDFESGLAIVKKDRKQGVIDKEGKWVVKNTYDAIERIAGERFIGKRGGIYDLISKDGNLLLKDYQYINDSGFHYLVKKDNKYGIIMQHKQDVKKPEISLSGFQMRVDGKFKNASAYLIDGASYIRIRDVADLLKESKSKFDVEYQAHLNRAFVHKKSKYKGGESPKLQPIDGNTVLKKSAFPLYVDGVAFDLDSYFINGNNFYKLRDLGILIGFKVDWDSKNKVILIEGR